MKAMEGLYNIYNKYCHGNNNDTNSTGMKKTEC